MFNFRFSKPNVTLPDVKIDELPKAMVDAMPMIAASPHDDHFVRLAIVVPEADNVSIDFVAPDGHLLMRTNVFNHENGKPSIDVIPVPKQVLDLTVQAWNNGARVLFDHVRTGLISICRF